MELSQDISEINRNKIPYPSRVEGFLDCCGELTIFLVFIQKLII